MPLRVSEGNPVTHPLRLQHFAQIDYHSAWQWQRETADAVRNGAADVLALLQHAPVYTFGRRARYDHLLVEPETLTQRGAELVESDRGGDVTFHGPGQIVGYPILNLKRRALAPVDYVRGLEETLIRALDHFDVTAGRISGRPGVWVGGAKIGALGVRVQAGVSLHGFALNVEPDLSWFSAIVPCGISDAGVTSIERVLGRSPGIAAVEDALVEAFCAVFDAEVIPPSRPSVRESILSHGR